MPKKIVYDPVPPLRWASSLGQLEEVRKLLDEGEEDIECVGGIPSTTSLQIAAYQGPFPSARNLSPFRSHAPRALLLLTHPPTRLLLRATLSLTSLLPPLFPGHEEVLKLLLEHKANVHTTSNTGETPLHDAVSEGTTPPPLQSFLLLCFACPESCSASLGLTDYSQLDKLGSPGFAVQIRRRWRGNEPELAKLASPNSLRQSW